MKFLYNEQYDAQSIVIYSGASLFIQLFSKILYNAQCIMHRASYFILNHFFSKTKLLTGIYQHYVCENPIIIKISLISGQNPTTPNSD